MDQVLLGILAIFAGLVVGALLFVPFVAISYRRRGGLGAGRILLWGAALTYFLAIWSYTLLPLPEADAVICAGTNLDPLAFIDDIRGAIGRGRPATDPATLQLVLNVALFVPLGFFLRVLGGRGIVVAALVGLGTSLLIETTQITGVWGIYPCAYRVFDVDDLLTNTIGALIGSLLAFVVPRERRGFVRTGDPGAPRPVTRWRRGLAMMSDYVAASVVSGVLALGTQLVLLQVGADTLVRTGIVASLVGAAGASILWLVVTLVTAQTVGDLAVRLEYRGGWGPEWFGRTLRWLVGIGGFLLLGAIPSGFIGLITAAYVVLAIVLLFTTRDGRGIPGVVTGRMLADDRAPADPGRRAL